MHNNDNRQTKYPSMETMNTEIRCLNTNEIEKCITLKASEHKQSGNADGLSIDFIKDTGELQLEKTCNNFYQLYPFLFCIKYLEKFLY